MLPRLLHLLLVASVLSWTSGLSHRFHLVQHATCAAGEPVGHLPGDHGDSHHVGHADHADHADASHAGDDRPAREPDGEGERPRPAHGRTDESSGHGCPTCQLLASLQIHPPSAGPEPIGRAASPRRLVCPTDDVRPNVARPTPVTARGPPHA